MTGHFIRLALGDGLCADRQSPSFLPSYLFLLPATYLWTLDDIYKLRIRVQNANMYMHMS